MKGYGLVMFSMMAFFLGLFVVVEWLDMSLLTNPSAVLHRGGFTAGATGVLLLILDVFLPVPSSLVMTGHGTLFGIGMGTALSLFGSMGAAALGFYLGRRGAKLLDRLVSDEERKRANQWIERWGAVGIVATRPIPLVAETVTIVAGASSLTWGKLLSASLAGSLPTAFLYAVTGATAMHLPHSLLPFGLATVIAGIFWVIGRKL
jgi:uncharacterized membrane protein YdjX (TVP38/TMEM64 family)